MSNDLIPTLSTVHSHSEFLQVRKKSGKGQEKGKFFKIQEKSQKIFVWVKSQKILKSCQKISMNRHKVRKFEPKWYVLVIVAVAIFCHSIPTCILSIKKVALIGNLNIPFALNFTSIVKSALNQESFSEKIFKFDELWW